MHYKIFQFVFLIYTPVTAWDHDFDDLRRRLRTAKCYPVAFGLALLKIFNRWHTRILPSGTQEIFIINASFERKWFLIDEFSWCVSSGIMEISTKQRAYRSFPCQRVILITYFCTNRKQNVVTTGKRDCVESSDSTSNLTLLYRKYSHWSWLISLIDRLTKRKQFMQQPVVSWLVSGVTRVQVDCNVHQTFLCENSPAEVIVPLIYYSIRISLPGVDLISHLHYRVRLDHKFIASRHALSRPRFAAHVLDENVCRTLWLIPVGFRCPPPQPANSAAL